MSMYIISTVIPGGIKAVEKIVEDVEVGFARRLSDDSELLKQVVADCGSDNLIAHLQEHKHNRTLQWPL